MPMLQVHCKSIQNCMFYLHLLNPQACGLHANRHRVQNCMFYLHLFNPKARGLHTDRHRKELLHLLLALINGHIDTVEACMSTREHLDISVPMQGEFSDIPVISL